MTSEQELRDWFERWLDATTRGDLELARSLIADDAVFLVPGQEPMDKETFARGITAVDPERDFHLECSLEEVQVRGNLAWLRSRIRLQIEHKTTGESAMMAGHSLSLLEKRNGHWLVIRDANTVVPVAQ